ncbi:MAG: CHAT domain-containing protein [Caldilineaceae bacterium]|nr:CHAT domain-containing protein [Caldilineaceae bacterium]
MSDGEDADELSPAFLTDIAALRQEEAIAHLRASNRWNVPGATSLAHWALERAEVEPRQAANALALAMLIAAENDNPQTLLGQIAYAEARIAVHSGDLAAAEAALLRAQEHWRVADARGAIARSYLGLTQVLTMQGRYAEAEGAIHAAVDALQALVESDPGVRILLARAHRNRATLYVYQEQHAAAREAYGQAAVELARFAATLPEDEQGELDPEFGHIALNVASAHTFLDAPDEAERSLQEAIEHFDRAGDGVNRGRAQTNLGRLYLRLGEYAAALAAFDQASRDLLGDLPVSASGNDAAQVAVLRHADELLLEHALAYAALNLLPEASLALERCEQLFRETGQPYELAQSRYARGLLALQQGAWQASQEALDEALALYDQLGNLFWRNRTQMARARLALAQGDSASTAQMLDELLNEPELITPTGAVAWDLLGLVEARLLRLHLWLESGETDKAEDAALGIEELLGISTTVEPLETAPLPHLSLRLLHGRGRIAAARGDDALARRHFRAAVELLDRQRATLPLEEVRTAYLDDKMAIYGDLVVSLLVSPLPRDNEVAAAFAVVERARSRALLDRLLASVESGIADESEAIRAQRAALRRQLHWLYNQLLGESGNRRLDGGLSREVAQQEAALQQLEWRSAPLLAQAEPVSLADLQANLAPDQQAVAYFFAGDEVLAFVVARDGAQVVRRLTTVEAVTAAQAELRFQLGRAEMGNEYVARHRERLTRGVQAALGALYQQLVATLCELLVAPRILLIPYGGLHMLPFHALWDGERYWLEQVELSYVPSASIAVRRRRELADRPLASFAGFAPYDERIPQAQAEIEAAATFFPLARTYHNDAASMTNVTDAASTSDVLHLATHGLFRPDNSFFSVLKLADGWLDVREIYRLPLQARLVVLSACESGVGEVRAGDEVVGLARGFLAAGTQSLIASLWNVHDRSAAELMAFFYRTLQGNGAPEDQAVRPAAALRAAQLNALRRAEHPYFWAPFFAIG